MTEELRVSGVRFSAAPRHDVRSGLIGFLDFEVCGICLRAVTLRRNAAGEFVLSYPERTDSRGVRRALFFPRDEAVRLELQRQVLRAIGFDCDEVRP